MFGVDKDVSDATGLQLFARRAFIVLVLISLDHRTLTARWASSPLRPDRERPSSFLAGGPPSRRAI
jgi:hypothetical protein